MTRNGSRSSTAVAANASSRTRDAGRPSPPAVHATAAIADARSTEGSNLVTRAKKPISPSVRAQRDRNPRRVSSGDASTNT